MVNVPDPKAFNIPNRRHPYTERRHQSFRIENGHGHRERHWDVVYEIFESFD